MQDKNVIWWTGVVEDRNDPEKLGRCRVRIFGYHTENLGLLPTEDLPWALPLQSVTSAASSGVGSTPVGIVPGTWVVGWFLDGDNAQQPLIVGTLAGKPETNTQTKSAIQQEKSINNLVRDSRDNIVYDENGIPIQIDTRTKSQKELIAALAPREVDTLLNTISSELSANDITKIGKNNELGKYQFTVERLIELGYIKKPLGETIYPAIINDPEYWTGKDNIKNKEEFLNNSVLQDSIMLNSTLDSYKTLLRLGKITEKDKSYTVAGLLFTSHLFGAKNSDKLEKKDLQGVKAKDYFIKGNSALGGEEIDFIKVFEDRQTYLPEEQNNDEINSRTGFSDPDKKYPKYEYAGLSDINKLAVGNNNHTYFKIKENNRIEKIPLAKSNSKWDEPESAFSSVYPFNQVFETEAGHVIELDSTPNAERIHVFHKKGTYIEIDVNGSMVRKVIGDNYEIVDRNNFVYVKGANNLTVEGKTSILVKDDAVIEVDGNLSVTGHGDTTVKSATTVGVVSKNVIVSAKENLDLSCSGSVNIQGKDINLYAKGGSLGVKSDNDLSMQSGSSGTFSIKGGIQLLLDAILVKTKMGANTIRGLNLPQVDPPEVRNPDKSIIPPLKRTIVREDIFLFDSEEEGSQQYKQSQIDAGKINDNIVPKEGESTPTVRSFGGVRSTVIPVDPGCEDLLSYNSFPRSFKLSKYFTLGNLLIGNRGSSLVAQKGLTELDIVCNLRKIAINCLDPIKEKYKDMIVTSGFRIGGEDSEHNIGAAVDLQFTRTDFSEYIEIAKWIQSNVPYRQLLLEYRFNNSSSKLEATWIHISLQIQNSNIVPSNRSPIATIKNHSIYASNKFVNLA